MIWRIQTESEKAFCHSQKGTIYIQNFLLAFWFVSNLLSNWRPEMVLYLKQPKAWPKNWVAYKNMCNRDVVRLCFLMR